MIPALWLLCTPSVKPMLQVLLLEDFPVSTELALLS